MSDKYGLDHSQCPLVNAAIAASCGAKFAHGVINGWCVRPKGHSGPHQGPTT